MSDNFNGLIDSRSIDRWPPTTKNLNYKVNISTHNTRDNMFFGGGRPFNHRIRFPSILPRLVPYPSRVAPPSVFVDVWSCAVGAVSNGWAPPLLRVGAVAGAGSGARGRRAAFPGWRPFGLQFPRGPFGPFVAPIGAPAGAPIRVPFGVFSLACA